MSQHITRHDKHADNIVTKVSAKALERSRGDTPLCTLSKGIKLILDPLRLFQLLKNIY